MTNHDSRQEGSYIFFYFCQLIIAAADIQLTNDSALILLHLIYQPSWFISMPQTSIQEIKQGDKARFFP